MEQEIELEDIFDRVIRDKEAFPWMISHPKVKPILDGASCWAAKKFDQDRSEVRDLLVFKLFENIEKIRNPRALDGWCYRVAKNYSLDEIERANTEIGYADETTLGNVEGKKRGGRPLVQNWSVLTLEQEPQLTEILWEAVDSFPRDLVEAWVSGLTPKEIAKERNVPLATTYGTLKRLQKAILKATFGFVGRTPDKGQCDIRAVTEIARECLLLSLVQASELNKSSVAGLKTTCSQSFTS